MKFAPCCQLCGELPSNGDSGFDSPCGRIDCPRGPRRQAALSLHAEVKAAMLPPNFAEAIEAMRQEDWKYCGQQMTRDHYETLLRAALTKISAAPETPEGKK